MRIIIDSKWCKGCEICIRNCPKKVLELGAARSERGNLMPVAKRPEDCVGCLLCERLCPDLCIDIQK